MRKIICTVTNDLTYDRRMQRICTSLARHGYRVQLVGRTLPHSIPLEKQPFDQHRLHCRFRRGFPFYAEYNIRLWFYLMRTDCDAVCSIDLDTLPAGCLATLLRRKKRVFDAHEYFTEVPEVTNRPFVKFIWNLVARLCLPFYRHAYTVGPALAAIFEKKYGMRFGVVRNVAQAPPAPPLQGGSAAVLGDSGGLSQDSDDLSLGSGDLGLDSGDLNLDSGLEAPTENTNPSSKQPKIYTTAVLPPCKGGAGGACAGGAYILYQGALNEGRGIEQLLEAMQHLEGLELWLAGEGDLSEQLRQRAVDLGVQDKVHFLGLVKPADLPALTRQAWLGLNLLENKGLSYYYSLANKFFDYVHAGVPCLTMNFPEYRALNAQHEVAVLLDQLSPEAIVAAIKNLQGNPAAYQRLQQATEAARLDWNWEREEQELLRYWAAVWQ